jgi:hypothetical protein
MGRKGGLTKKTTKQLNKISISKNTYNNEKHIINFDIFLGN